ncbi:MAG: DUF5808 domain-containing protein [Bacteroidota bacterium]|nr:DUF5808 domain-containing protein [Bacteroidota bacterium]MDP4193124.1 DUF5808 domain-containing protein [Bacteroidota bacterium]MDP4196381.1 DUF5808 domain-containing protein [Bacteroidota bacterium]
MEQNDYKKFNWWVEVFTIFLIIAEIFFVISHNALQKNISAIIVQILVYLVLSIIFFYSVTPEVLFNESDTPIRLKRTNISKETSNSFLKIAIMYLGLTKLAIIAVFPVMIFSQMMLKTNPLVFLALNFIVIFYFISLFMKYLALSKGYIITKLKDVILNLIFYYNPEDERAVVDKPVGVGSTVNLATKQGKIIMVTILAIPIVIILGLFIALALAGKL